MNTQQRLRDEHSVRLAVGLTGYALQIPAELILSSAERDHRIVRARQVAMYLSHIGLGMSLARVASALGRDRSTVAHACHRIEDMRDDPDVDNWLDELEARLKGAANIEQHQRDLSLSPRPLQSLQLS
ncbi:MAG: chromosomal replication initiator DnaA [Henriciella sp.]|jgi:chromosomal replication initiation ATPase DnaA|uniref:helix-turn-helix domain-containing protein n=1 Tax=Henriciella sp. TaxID=1968823 RepID=UPI000C10AF85|nr:helix-turn-helix domain-containing protein [Henriciella sp.]MAN74100.1 chromosomal replication initiator DnaA [Henriciella sp.]MBF34226.1 chromosomal replication initiator DnaA [Hyphomonadaceae bacterium]PHR75593.1 MAG: chromosomal replication initiator DnaA [Henriciella sp.]|tara:strand:- start:141 stop:524 length:384 start_codon:yes stop_codon:yes gene_type:complete